MTQVVMRSCGFPSFPRPAISNQSPAAPSRPTSAPTRTSVPAPKTATSEVLSFGNLRFWITANPKRPRSPTVPRSAPPYNATRTTPSNPSMMSAPSPVIAKLVHAPNPKRPTSPIVKYMARGSKTRLRAAARTTSAATPRTGTT